MNKKMAFIVALGCAYAGATSTVNYDLLGRKGSKMNSPMVYKNIDYSKMKKDKQQVGSSLEVKSLAKNAGPGFQNNADAITGVFNNRGLEHQNNTYPYYMKRYFQQGAPLEGWYSTLGGESGYMKQSNQVFFPVPMERKNPVNLQYGVRTNVPSSEYSLSTTNYTFNNNSQPSPYSYSQYGNTEMINYMPFSAIENYAKRYSIWWYDNPSYTPNPEEWDDVGIYMSIDALPVKLDPNKSVPYLKLASGELFEPTPETEMLSSRTYDVIKTTAKNSVIFVGSEFPVMPEDHPLNPNHRSPLIYMGIHNRQYGNVDNQIAKQYSFESMVVDNGVYNRRRVEVVPAGNFTVRNNSGHLGLEAHAANAITVGAVDAETRKITSYNSTQSYYCTLGLGQCNDGNNLRIGPRKPEIYNFSHYYFDHQSNSNYPQEQKRVYTNRSTGIAYTYNPYYDGSEMAAAYTAGQIANLLSANPYYRWHPEMVKALMLTSGDVSINTPYPNGTPVTTKMPSYYSMLTDQNHNEVFHESRYWVGEISKLYTHYTDDGKKEIRFSVKRPTDKSNFTAAIAWLSDGFDLVDAGRVPQDIDLYVYESNTSNVNNLSNLKVSSTDGYNSYERKSFTSNANYLIFRILVYADYTLDNSENKGKIVLGFDLAGI